MTKTIKPLLRGLKFLLIFTALFFLLSFLAVTFLANRYFSRSEINYLVTGQLQDFFSRPVKLSSVQLDMSGYLKIKGLQVYRKNSAEFFIKSDYLLVSCDALSFLSGNFKVKSVKLISPAINLVKDKKGDWNFYDILENYRNRGKSGKISLVGFEIEDGKINVRDEKRSYAHSFDNIDFRTGDVDLSEAINFNFSTYFKSDYLSSPKPGRIYVEGVFRPENMNLEKASIKDVKCEISVNGMNFQAYGTLLNLKSPEADFSLLTPPVNLKKILKTGTDFPLPESRAQIRLKKLADGKYLAEGGVDSLNASFTSLLDYEKGRLVYSADVVLNGVNAEKINFILDKHIKNPKGKLNMKMFMKGAWGAKPDKLRITSDSAALSFKDIYRSIDFRELTGKMLITGDFQALNVTGGSAAFAGNSAKNVNFRWEQEKGLESFSTSFRFNAGKVRARGSLRRKGPRINNSEIMIHNEKTDLDKITSLVYYFRDRITAGSAGKKASGKYNFFGTAIKALYKSTNIDNEYGAAQKLYSYCEIRDFQPSFADTDGNFRIKLINGRFYNIQQNAEKNKFYYLISLPITTLYRLNRFGALKIQSELKNMEFQEVGADYTVNNGKIVINSFYINGKDFLAYTRGNIDLKEEKLDLMVYTVSNKYYSMGGLPESLTDAKGRPAMAFKLKGKFKNNDIKILDPNYNLNVIQEAIKKGVDIDIKKIDNF
ncbi:MAG: hypothetical protein COT17_04775 [Elusimicrobia bacterium CG08_land_8_20_14_0_20_51_18]|nr:MAG: hypothetical protein COT17_04775 [Elusimicrobia bacterium CG08_land_8_20_14_0_20_51_18]